MKFLSTIIQIKSLIEIPDSKQLVDVLLEEGFAAVSFVDDCGPKSRLTIQGFFNEILERC